MACLLHGKCQHLWPWASLNPKQKLWLIMKNNTQASPRKIMKSSCYGIGITDGFPKQISSNVELLFGNIVVVNPNLNNIRMACNLSHYNTHMMALQWLKELPIMMKSQKSLPALQMALCADKPHRWLAPSWSRHQMETFSASLALDEGNSPVTGVFPSLTWRPVTRSLDIFLIYAWTNG